MSIKRKLKSMRLREDLIELIQQKCEAEHRSFTNYVEHALTVYMENN